MPTYVYQCLECEEIFDVQAPIREKEAGLHPICPRCEAQHTRQLITAGLFVKAGGSAGRMPPAGSSCCGSGFGSGCCG